MGFRYRKSVNIGPVRINFSKSGIGYSIGCKGFRYTKKANGGTRKTYSIPGTGFSYVQETGKNTEEKKKQEKRAQNNSEYQNTHTNGSAESSTHPQKTIYCSHCYKLVDESERLCPNCGQPLFELHATSYTEPTNTKPFYSRWWFALLAILGIILPCILLVKIASTDPLEGIYSKPIDTSAYQAPALVPSYAFPTEPKVQYKPIYGFSDSSDQKETSRTYILNTSTKKFHYSTCSSVPKIKSSNKGSFTGTRSEIIAQGYSACGRCNP